MNGGSENGPVTGTGRRGWLKKPGIRFEIVVSLVLLVVAAAGLMGLLVFRFMRNEMIALQIGAGFTMAKTIESRFDPRLPDGGVQWMLLELSNAGFDRVVVADRFLNPMIVSDGGPWKAEPSREMMKTAVTTRQVQTVVGGKTWWVFGQGPVLEMAVPVFSGLQVVGVVGLYSRLEHLDAAWKRTRTILVLYLALDTLIVVVFGSILLSRRVVAPLRRIGVKVREFAEGRYRPGNMDLNGDDEIGRLEDAFERMAGQILGQKRKLEDNLLSLERAQEQLVRSEKLATVGHLAAGLAHELGNPLGSLLGFVHLLRDDETTEAERLDYLDRMTSELTRMDAIIRSLLDFARSRPAKAGPVDLNKVLADAIALAEVQKWFSGLETEMDLAPDLPPAHGEEGAVTQVLLNLLVNAGQAMAGQGRLRVATGREGAEVFVLVRDTGPGIPHDDLGRIFEPFFTRKEPGRGTGLGLSVSLSIMESFGGRIEVESREGEGATFKAVLPMADAAEVMKSNPER